MRLKPAVRLAHGVLTLLAGLPLVVLAVTGALLVFPEWTRRAVHGDAADPSAGLVRPPSELLAAMRAALPAGDRVVRIQYPVAPGEPLTARTAGGREVVLDPHAARVLRVVEPGGFDANGFLVRLHVDLFAGAIGSWVTGLAAGGLLLLAATGLFLWWPRGPWAWHYVGVKWSAGPARRVYDLHRATGLYASSGLVLVAGTGLVMSFPPLARPLYWATGSPDEERRPPGDVAAAGPGLSPEAVVAVALAAYPGTEVYRLYPPKEDGAPYRVFVVEPADRRTRVREARLAIHPVTGEVLHDDGPRTLSAAGRLMRWVLPLHFGTFGGTATRVLYVAVSLSPVLLAATGVMVWRRRLARGASGR